MAVLTPQPIMQFTTAAGVPLSGGKLYTYAAGTTTPQQTFTDASGATPNTNPVILDSRGEAPVWLGSASYKFKLTDANDVELWTVDNISAPTSGVSPVLSGNVTIDSDTPGVALKITQTGTGPVLRVQDSADPDTTPFIIDNAGQVGVGTATPSASLDVVGAAKINTLTLTGGPLSVANGGTGLATLTANNVVLGNGTSAPTFVAPGTSGNVLTSNGSTWTSAAVPVEIPTQTGNAGKVLTTDGSTVSWGTEGSVRARANVSGTTVTAAFNVASVSSGGTGVYNVAFTNALATSSYQAIVTLTSLSATNDAVCAVTSRSTTGFTVEVKRGATGAATTASFSCVVFGGW